MRARLVCEAIIWSAATLSNAKSPPDSLADYHAAVRQFLKEAFLPDVSVRVIVQPSFSSEYAVGIRQVKGGYSLFSVEAAGQLWGYTVVELMKQGQITVQNSDGSPGTAQAIRRIQSRLPKDPNEVRHIRCEAPMDRALAERVITDWKETLARTPAWNRSAGLDGETYEFSATGVLGDRSIWSPEATTLPGMLVDMSQAMKTYCKTREPRELETINEISSKLEGQLKASAPRAAR